MVFRKQGSTVKEKSYSQGKEIEIVEQYTYLEFTLIPSSKKHKDIENFLKKASKVWLAIQRALFKSKKKTLDTYLHLTERLLSQLDLTLVKAGVIAIKKAKLK